MLPSLAAFAPVVLLLTAAGALRRPGIRPGALPAFAEGAALVALFLAAAGGLQVAINGPIQLSLAGGSASAFSLSLTLDAVGAVMSVLVAFIGWVVVRYSRTYLDGAPREGAFHGLMLFTLASVLVLVMAGSLTVLIAASVAVGLGLRALLLFHAERAEARRAAAKFSWVWHAGDAALILAALLLGWSVGSGSFASACGDFGPATSMKAVATPA